MLFSEKDRSYQGPKTYIEGDFEYLDRSARSEAQRVREFLNKWISRFPKDEAKELTRRIESGDRRAFESATFEITLFAIVSGLGGQLEAHPKLENGSEKRPDFLVRLPSGNEFYLEAVLASEYSEAEIAAERRKNVVLAAIERLDSPNFFIGIRAEGNPDTPPPGKLLRRELSNWLSSLDPDAVTKNAEGLENQQTPTMRWEHDGWCVNFEAIPILPERRGMGQRVIGMLSDGARWINQWEPIRDAIRSKGGRYGELNKPFVIAVNFNGFSLDRIDEMQALFGQEEYVFNRLDPQGQPEMRRAPNGAWSGPDGPQYTRVSGAWLFGNITPWNLVSRKNTLYLNPWSQTPIPDDLKVLNHAAVSERKMVWVPGAKLSELLGLSDSWPE